MIKRLTTIFTIILLFSSFLSINLTVSAHSNATDFSPKENEVLQESPELIELQFSAGIEHDFSLIYLMKETGEFVNVELSNKDKNDLIAEFAELDEGVYHVYYRILSEDTHIVDGAYRFAVRTELTSADEAVFLSFDEVVEKAKVYQQEQEDALLEQEVIENEEQQVETDHENNMEDVAEEETVTEATEERGFANSWILFGLIGFGVLLAAVILFRKKK
ncbi:copper resistance protein CopC [Anaerobacillus sp. MEB173]|uniref:copper resistance CopC family protein n=1 Tax=Anaerobacillus sp. MEB173 TaxID=3383345 RepID=UPI003F8F6217